MKAVVLLETEEAEFVLDILKGNEKDTDEVKDLANKLEERLLLAEGTIPLDSQK